MKNGSRFRLLVMVMLIGAAPILASEQPAGEPPKLSNLFVTWPLFNIKGQEPLSAGKAFAVELDDGRKVLLSCLHLFGPDGGLDNYIMPSQLPASVTGVTLMSLDGTRQVGNAGHELLSSGKPIDNVTDGNFTGDLVAFELPKDTPLGHVPIIKKTPQIGTRVWLVTRFAGDTKSGATLYPGKITSADGKCTEVTLDAPMVLRASSGAPVLNTSGELVGMLLGGASEKPIKVILNPGESIHARLEHEL